MHKVRNWLEIIKDSGFICFSLYNMFSSLENILIFHMYKSNKQVLVPFSVAGLVY